MGWGELLGKSKATKASARLLARHASLPHDDHAALVTPSWSPRSAQRPLLLPTPSFWISKQWSYRARTQPILIHPAHHTHTPQAAAQDERGSHASCFDHRQESQRSQAHFQDSAAACPTPCVARRRRRCVVSGCVGLMGGLCLKEGVRDGRRFGPSYTLSRVCLCVCVDGTQ